MEREREIDRERAKDRWGEIERERVHVVGRGFLFNPPF